MVVLEFDLTSVRPVRDLASSSGRYSIVLTRRTLRASAPDCRVVKSGEKSPDCGRLRGEGSPGDAGGATGGLKAVNVESVEGIDARDGFEANEANEDVNDE
jgi:hypothetical protein